MKSASGEEKQRLPGGKRIYSTPFILLAISLFLHISLESQLQEEEMSVPVQSKASILILRDDIPVAGAASSPEYLASILESAGHEVTFVSAADLCSEELMRKENFDVLVLPYGASYPAMGKDALVSYLKGGGNFLSTGGYAFDNLLIHSNGEWKPIPDDTDIRINTRKGEARDSLGLHPDQIGVFDPSYPLERVSYIEAAPGQFIFHSKFRIEGEFEGYAASSMAGSNSPVFPQRYGRWIPLLYARDAYGRLRGSAGAIVHNYAGPYAGSSWAYFGVTNYDLFAPDSEMATSALVRLVDSLIDKKFITELSTGLACYRPGEENVKISVAGPAGCNVSLEIYADGDEIPVFESREEFTDGAAEVIWSPENFESDFYRIEARLLVGGQTIDMVETGFVVWNGKVISDGFPLKFSENYFRDGDRPIFLSGTNQTGMMFASANENPLVWKHDLEKMSDHGVNILRILHFSPFVVGATHASPRVRPEDLKIDALPEKLERQLDAIVQLCQKYKVILFLSLHDWMGVELSDEELAAQRKFAQVVASRYRNVPGIMYDVQNEPTVRLSNQPDIRREFNNYLEEKHGSTEALRAAWRRDPPAGELGDVDVSPGSEDWDDVKAFDVDYFKTIILNRWVKANADGVRAGDPGRPLTVGYLPWMHPADKILGTEHVDFSNMHFYGDPGDFPRQLKLIDRRFEGKSFSLGEFGAKVHSTWRLGGSITTMKGGIDWFLRVGHYALGMGASFIANWDWKDMPDCVFPWGINHPCDVVPKDILLAYRSQSMFFRNIQPRYEEPELYLLVPDSHRLGGQAKRVTEAILNSIDLLLSCHVDFGVINEYSLRRGVLLNAPTSAKAIIYPIPFCLSDETYHQVRNFVWNGGVLYLSGDISYDQYWNKTRQDRLEELCGVRYVGERYPNIAGSHEPAPCIRVTPTTASVLERSDDAWPVIMTNSLGKGRVFYCADPIEFHASSPDIYRDFLDFAGVKRIPLEPDDPSIRVFRLPTAMDETVYVLFNESEEGKQVTLKIGTEPITLSIGAGKPGLIKVTASVGTRHAVSLLESQGETTIGSEVLMDTNCHVMIASLDDQSIDRSKSLMVLPIEPGHLRIATQMDWKNPIVGVGETRSGKWRCLGKIEPEFSDGYLSFCIDELQSLNILLIAEADSPLIKGD
jgi:hypothetical protein